MTGHFSLVGSFVKNGGLSIDVTGKENVGSLFQSHGIDILVWQPLIIQADPGICQANPIYIGASTHADQYTFDFELLLPGGYTYQIT